MHTFYTVKHYKIWFSDNRDVFLDKENQLEFIRIITKNPNLILSFLYSSSCLNSKSQAELKSFCAQYKIIPVDFDTEINAMIMTGEDRELFELAKIEIKITVEQQGGNLAAASDYARHIAPVIFRCGIYEDFELDYDYKDVPDFIIADPGRAILQGFHPQVETDLAHECAFSYLLLQGYFKKFPNSTTFQLRKFIQTAYFTQIINLLDERNYCRYVGAKYRDELPVEQMKSNFGKLLLKQGPEFYGSFKAATPEELAETVTCRFIRNRLLTRSVVAISGPQTLFSIVDFPKQLTTATLKQGCEKIMLSDISKSLLGCYKTRSETRLATNPLEKISTPNFQLSWTLEGKMNKNQRINKMGSAATVLQSIWRGRTVRKSLLAANANAQPISKKY